MYLSPSPNRGSYLSNIEQKQTSEDYFSSSPHSQYSSSKQIDKKQRKAHSINEMIRKVEYEIQNSEINIQQVNLEQKSKSSNHSCNNSFSSVLQQQQQLQQQLNTQNMQLQSNYQQSASPCQQSKQINHNNYYYPTQSNHGYYVPPVKHHSQTHSIDVANKTSFDSYQDNVNSISRISTTKQSIFPQNTMPSASNSSHIFSQQYVTMKDFRKILEEQLVIREQSIINQISSCLKEQIIPEIKRQVVKELDKKKQQIDTQLQNIQYVVQENMSVQQLDDKIYNLKMSFDRSKFLKAQTEMKTQTLDQKYQNLEERINKIEENTFEHISIFEQYKLENQKTMSDFRQSNRQICRINEIVEKLSRSYINLEYSVRKNYEDICSKINELDSTEEVPFNIKKDKYSQGLMKELNKCLSKDSNQADTSSNQTEKVSEVQEKQEPYCNNYKINLEQKNFFNAQNSNIEQNQNHIFNSYDKNVQRVLLESFEEEYDISPTLGRSSTKKQNSSDKCRLQPQKCSLKDENIQQNRNVAVNENDFDYDYSSKIREVNISNRNISQILKLRNKIENNQQIKEEIAEQIEESNDQEIPRAETQQSIDIHYVKKGLPQLFPLVQSTNFVQYEENSNLLCQQEDSEQIVNVVQSVACSDMKFINQNEILSLDDPIKLSQLDLNQKNSILNPDKESQSNFTLGNQVQSLNFEQLNLQNSNNIHNENQAIFNKNNSNSKENDENNYHSAIKQPLGSSNQCTIQNNSFSMNKNDSCKQKEYQDIQQNISTNKNRISMQSQNIEDLIQNKVNNNNTFSIADSQF